MKGNGSWSLNGGFEYVYHFMVFDIYKLTSTTSITYPFTFSGWVVQWFNPTSKVVSPSSRFLETANFTGTLDAWNLKLKSLSCTKIVRIIHLNLSLIPINNLS